MTSEIKITFMVISFIAAGISLYLSYSGIKRRKVLGAGSFAAMMLGIGIWSFFKGFEVYAESQFWNLFFLKLEYIGIMMIPPSLFFFSLFFSGLTTRFKLKWIIPFVIIFWGLLVLMGSNDLHNLYWLDNHMHTSRGLYYMDSTPGPMYWVNTIFSYSILFFSTIILIFSAARRANFYRIQSSLVILAILFPWTFNIITETGTSPYPEYDITIFSFIITGILLFYAFFRYNLLDLSPIARDKLMDHITDVVIVVDEKDRLIEINNPGKEVLDIDRISIFGRELGKLGGPHSDFLDRLLKMDFGTCEDTITKGNGSIHVEVRILPLEKRDKHPLGKIIIIKDISHLKKTELALKNARDHLEIKVRKRTMELEELTASLKNEVRDRKMAEEKTREEWARAELYLDLLGHDIGNLNQVLLGRTEMLKIKVKEDERLVEEVGIIEDTLKKAMNLVGDIHLISSIENKPLRTYPINVSYILEEVIRKISTSYSKCDFKLDMGKDLVDINIPAEPILEKAFYNIIDNGIKAQRGQEQKIEITVSIPPNDNGIVRIAIADYGLGIPDSFKTDLLDRKMKMGVKMLTGIGLITARAIIERFGGRITITDRDPEDHSKGAKFIIDLPCEHYIIT